MVMNNIRNFCIIAHIDHGKSTLADRLLEATGTIDKRKMKAQFLDQLELERERGITIKMAPVRMHYQHTTHDTRHTTEYIFNLIDTPGHPDFGYEVSRALEAVEGAILLVDGMQGIQAQTLSNLYAAQKAGLTIIGAINKVDLVRNHTDQDAELYGHNSKGDARTEQDYTRYAVEIQSAVTETASLLQCDPRDIVLVSGKTGFGVDILLDKIISTIPAPQKKGVLGQNVSRALVFDSFYDDHKGIIAVVRVFDGLLQKGMSAELIAVREKITIKEVGYVLPQMSETPTLYEGEIGYVVTGLKDPHKIKIGDTLLNSKFQIPNSKPLALPGYKEPNPVVFVSFFPNEADDYDDLKKSLERLKLNDSSFTYEPDFNEVLGRGFKGGFLGKLHFEIIAQRLNREFGISTITSFPSVAYKIKASPKILPQLARDVDGYVIIQNPKDLPSESEEILEPMIRVELVCPASLMGSLLGLQELFRWEHIITETLADRVIIRTRMPLAELISDFDDRIKSISGGFASFSYEPDGYQKSDLARLDVLVANELVPGLSRILPKRNLDREARAMVLRLKDILPRQQFSQAIQAYALGRIVARETIPAFKKDVGNFGKNGGDRTRKMKLWKKQKEGKKKLLSMAKVRIAPEDFKKLLSKN
jgi:GTP-binding protein LepA